MFTFKPFVVCALLLLPSIAGADTEPRPAVLRVLSTMIASTLRDSYRTSPTIRSLVDELEQSDLVIHVTGLSADESTRFSGTTRFVTVAGGRRFLRIAVNEQLMGDAQAGILGHEFQHAVEVAREPWVVDQLTFEGLYRHIGQPSSAGSRVPTYDTAGARHAGERVMSKLREARHALAALGTHEPPARAQ